MTTATRVKKNLGHQLYDAWRDSTQEYGQKDSKANVFFEDRTIYSYGHHFPMAIKMDDPNGSFWFLVNGDTYSSTTAKHQSEVRSALSDEKSLTVPFSALNSAGINPYNIELIEQETEKFIPVVVKDWKTGEPKIEQRHLMGSAVFKTKVTVRYPATEDTKGARRDWRTDTWFLEKEEYRWYLSGLDETGKNPWSSYFLSELPHEVNSVQEGYYALKPSSVVRAEEEDLEVLRQGEWFFIPVQDSDMLPSELGMIPTVKVLKQAEKDWNKGMEHPNVLVEKDAYLPNRREGRERRHLATRAVKLGEDVYVRGTVRHTGGEHKMLKLEGWYRAYENLEANSWVAQGNVD